MRVAFGRQRRREAEFSLGSRIGEGRKDKHRKVGQLSQTSGQWLGEPRVSRASIGTTVALPVSNHY